MDPAQLIYPTANKESYRKSFFISAIHNWDKVSCSMTTLLPCHTSKRG